MPLELMRLRLVDLIDRCLKLLEEEPTYVFHLDAQTVVLEDYLTIRTDRRSQLEKYIRDICSEKSSNSNNISNALGSVA